MKAEGGNAEGGTRRGMPVFILDRVRQANIGALYADLDRRSEQVEEEYQRLLQRDAGAGEKPTKEAA